jgi:hypothetical protein
LAATLRAKPRLDDCEDATAMRRALAGFALACLGAAASLGSASPVSAHGDFDQSLNGDPGCNSSNFPVSAGVSSSPRQEFVPSGTLLSSIGVCLGSGTGGTVDVHVRQGTAGSPGAIVGSKLGLALAAGAPTFLHADFLPASLPVTPGAKYVIEVISAGDVTWLGSADDQYAAGGTNAAVGDLAFRSYLDPTAPQPTATATSAPAQPSATATRDATRTPAPTSAAATATSTRAPAATAAAGVVAQPTSGPAGGTGAPAPRGAAAGSAGAPSGQAAAPVAGSGTAASRRDLTGAMVLLLAAAMVANGSALIFVASRGRER